MFKKSFWTTSRVVLLLIVLIATVTALAFKYSTGHNPFASAILFWIGLILLALSPFFGICIFCILSVPKGIWTTITKGKVEGLDILDYNAKPNESGEMRNFSTRRWVIFYIIGAIPVILKYYYSLEQILSF